MTRGAQTLPHPDAALLPPVRQSVARDLHAPTAVAAPGPMLTLCLPAVASGHPLTAKAGGVSSALRPLFSSSCVIQAPSNQGKGFDPKGFRVVLVAVLNRPANYRQRSAKLGIGGFHVSSLAAAPRLGAFA